MAGTDDQRVSMADVTDHIISPYIPAGLTIVWSPNTCLQVPAISSNALVSLGVPGAGSSSNPEGLNRVIWEGDDLGELSNAEMVKFNDFATGPRTETRCALVAFTDDVLGVRKSA